MSVYESINVDELEKSPKPPAWSLWAFRQAHGPDLSSLPSRTADEDGQRDGDPL